MRVDAFDFHLPENAIAQVPASPRDAARLLHVSSESINDLMVRDLSGLLRPGDVMVFNDTRVVPARLTGIRSPSPEQRRAGSRGARVELTLHKRDGPDSWRAFAKPARKLKTGDMVAVSDEFLAEVRGKGEDGEVALRFNQSGSDLEESLRRHGVMPLPPYIKRGPQGQAEDRDNYQTMFARKPGAVAAPTAGLHFTDRLLQSIEDRGVETLAVTLHVGAGTFLPVKADNTEDHEMHAEWGSIGAESAAAINKVKARGGRLVACGTTCLRLLESAADDEGAIHPFEGNTDIFITPGYRFKIVDRLMTNFHLPRSTLFMLVSAFCGLDRMRRAYAHAIDEGYRFYSYGDACFLERLDVS